ncbi:sideroflexin-4 isoform X2 [Emydura macquarii macquarii]|uniref:sideroflexin-4 isoform X2 n=1 Tax=Emydura macquarii macquarii TaxID=1129001 RepID=UPI00352A818B
MDVNLRFWSAEGKSFFQRFLHWADILDPTVLLKSRKEIEKSRLLLETSVQNLKEPVQDEQVKQAMKISLSSVHPGTGNIIPVVFRSPAFLPIASPMFFASFIQHRGAKQTFIWQLLFHAYTAGFAIANGNAAAKAEEITLSEKRLLLTTGAISYAALLGMFFGRILPIPLLACLGAFNVLVARGTEYENGIEVMDKDGNVIGVSKKAGMKAVEETALSRGALFGAALLIPESLLYFIQGSNFLLKNPHALAPLRLLLMVSSIGVLLPVSFSVFPQLGEIKRDDLETEILSSTEETQLFYNRGV